MTATVGRRPLSPLHGTLLAFPVALFVSALLSDYAYWSSFEIQWTNFASWLIAGGLFMGAFVVLWALVDLLRSGRTHRTTLYFGVVLAMWLLGFINALIHARDGWAAMPAGLVLSAIVAALALVAAWIGYGGFARGEDGR